jgi:hypothetical protein
VNTGAESSEKLYADRELRLQDTDTAEDNIKS